MCDNDALAARLAEVERERQQLEADLAAESKVTRQHDEDRQNAERRAAQAELRATKAESDLADLRARLAALVGMFERFRDGLRARSKATSRDRREANTWDVAAYRLRELVSDPRVRARPDWWPPEVALVTTRTHDAEVRAEMERLTHERTLLAEAIVKIARASGAWVGEQSLTGPQVLLLADDVIQEMEGSR